jgi:hypothetical protein
MDVFIREQLIRNYADYASSFIQIWYERVYEEVHHSLDKGLFWAHPLIQLNPRFEDGGSVTDYRHSEGVSQKTK